MDWHKFNNLKILIVDDDVFTRELIQAMLSKVPSITVHQAKDGGEALAMLENNKYDMFLLDLYMPNMSGKEFILHLKKGEKAQNSLSIVLITTDRLSRKELKDIGASYYLTKPFDFDNFLNDIYGVLEQKQLANET